jgi:hypothetical protein
MNIMGKRNRDLTIQERIKRDVQIYFYPVKWLVGKLTKDRKVAGTRSISILSVTTLAALMSNSTLANVAEVNTCAHQRTLRGTGTVKIEVIPNFVLSNVTHQ